MSSDNEENTTKNKLYQVDAYTMKCRIYPNKTQRQMIYDILHGVQAFCNMVAHDVTTEFMYTSENTSKTTGETIHFINTNEIKKAENLNKYRALNEYVKLIPASALSGKSKSCLDDVGKKFAKQLPDGRVCKLPVEAVKYSYYSKKNPRMSYTCSETLSKLHGSESNKNVFYFNFAKIGRVKVRGLNQKLRFGKDRDLNLIEFAKRNPKLCVFVTVSVDNCGDFWASFQFSHGVSKGKETGFYTYIPGKEPKKECVGLDMGVTSLVTTSDGKKYDNPQFACQAKNKLAYLNRKKSRAWGWANPKFREAHKRNPNIVPSKAYEKWCQKYAEECRDVSIKRELYHHEVTKEIIDEYKLIATETLKVKEMMDRDSLHGKRGTRKKAAKTASNLSDAAMSGFLNKLEYKSKWYQRDLKQIGAYDRSTGVCQYCGYTTSKKLDTSIREWTCPKCGRYNDRDISAAIVILKKGTQEVK